MTTITRRKFAQLGGATAALLGMAPRVILAADNTNTRDTLVVIFQRGAMDGLNAVVPYFEPAYYSKRPTIGVAKPGTAANAGIALNERFALHPSLLPLKALYDQGSLAIAFQRLAKSTCHGDG
jgi:uncharacterized protein (DUF1501 family)